LSVFRGWEAGKPCYRCLVGEDPALLGALTGVMGSLAALEAIRAIVPFGEDSAGKLLIADLLNLRFRTISLPADPACTACAAAREPCPA